MVRPYRSIYELNHFSLLRLVASSFIFGESWLHSPANTTDISKISGVKTHFTWPTNKQKKKPQPHNLSKIMRLYAS